MDLSGLHMLIADLKPLTSLRFVAAGMIVLLHSLLYFKWSWLNHVPATAAQGVSFFFVLSGFILTHVYRTRSVGYFTFMRARFARLYPVHVATLIIAMLFVRADLVTFDGPGIFSKWALLASNLTLTQSLAPFMAYQFSWNSVSWSISTEMFFYLAFPLLLVRRSYLANLAWAAVPIAAGVVFLLIFPISVSSENPYELTASSVLYTSPLIRGFAVLPWDGRLCGLDAPPSLDYGASFRSGVVGS